MSITKVPLGECSFSLLYECTVSIVQAQDCSVDDIPPNCRYPG